MLRSSLMLQSMVFSPQKEELIIQCHRIIGSRRKTSTAKLSPALRTLLPKHLERAIQ
uniref:Uncharacterized protein n=1 Tax=Brassica campestris TaxID=3711 RepID=M4EW64_BRACM